MKPVLQGRRALVAGGSRGLGRAMALQFAAAGAQVSVCARGQAGLQALQAEFATQGWALHTQACDLARADDIAAWVAAAAQQLGGIDILVNNASGLGMGDDEAGWQASLGVDVMAMVRSSQQALPWLRASAAGGRGPSIVNLSSISADRPSLRAPAYAAAKAAMNSYTASQAAQLGPEGIRVNAIAPGSIEFPGGLWEQRREQQPALYQRALQSIVLGRMGAPNDVAEVALFLVSAAARWITGQVIRVDGGQLLGA